LKTANQSVKKKPRLARGFSFVRRFKETDSTAWIVGVLLGALYVAAIVILNSQPQYVDERSHFAQETLIFRGDWRRLPELATIPGYHAFLALLMHALGTNDLDIARIVHACCSLAAIAAFFALRRRLWPGTETLATAQFLCFPFMTVLLFVIYTDVPAVALLLWATWAAVAGRTIISALLLCLLVLVRQHEVLWALLMIWIACPVRDLSELRERWRAHVMAAIPFTAPIALFLAFWWWNGSISLWRMEAHPDLKFHTGNVFTGLIAFGLLLPLQVAKGLGGFSRQVRVQPWLLIAPPLVFAAFWFGFRSNHPFNGQFFREYLRHFTPTRIAAGLIISASACSVWRVKTRPAGAGAPLAVLSIVFLSASWLIELRYLIAPFSLWLAMREHDDRWIEWATTALWLALAVFMIWAVVTTGFIV
jgi:DIE2/ALG10 family